MTACFQVSSCDVNILTSYLKIHHPELVRARVVVVHGQDETFRQGEHDREQVHLVHQLERTEGRRGSNHLIQLATHPLAAHLSKMVERGGGGRKEILMLTPCACLGLLSRLLISSTDDGSRASNRTDLPCCGITKNKELQIIRATTSTACVLSRDNVVLLFFSFLPGYARA